VLSIAVHMSLELSGSISWACVRGRCEHRHHRVLGDLVICFLLAVLTVHVVG
jgi:hypothetical protein